MILYKIIYKIRKQHELMYQNHYVFQKKEEIGEEEEKKKCNRFTKCIYYLVIHENVFEYPDFVRQSREKR